MCLTCRGSSASSALRSSEPVQVFAISDSRTAARLRNRSSRSREGAAAPGGPRQRVAACGVRSSHLKGGQPLSYARARASLTPHVPSAPSAPRLPCFPLPTPRARAVGGLRLGGGAKPPTPPNGAAVNPEVCPVRYVVFIVGGVTHSEIRCMRELQRENPGVTITIGGTSILTPCRFLNQVRKLTAEEEE